MNLMHFNHLTTKVMLDKNMVKYSLSGNLPSDTDDEDFVPGEMTSSDDSDQNTTRKSAKGINFSLKNN